jgi:hypothetical protein
MAPYRPRRKSNVNTTAIVAGIAVFFFLAIIIFILGVYFFAPLPEEEAAASASRAATAAAKTGAASKTAPADGAIGGTAKPPSGPAAGGTPIPPVVVTGLTAPSGVSTITTTVPPAGIVFKSILYPYSMTVAKDWTARPGTKVGNLTVDAFLGPRQGDFTPSITVYGQKVAVATDSDAFTRSNMQTVFAGGAAAQAQANAEPTGAKASIVTYPATSGELKYNVNQVFFVQMGMGWVVTLSSMTAPGAETGAYVPTLRQMLASFRAE